MGYKRINWKAYKATHLLLLCIGLLLYSCEREDMPHSNQGIPATFTPTMGELTRVDNNVWSGTETVGIFSVTNGGTLPADVAFRTYKPSGSGTRVQLKPTAKDQTIYYRADGTEVNFIAFAPYTEAPYSTCNGNVVTYNLNDQTTKERIEKLDLIYHKDNTAYSESNPVAVLRFEHKLSRIVINITRKANFAYSLTGITNFGIQNVPYKAACNLATGTITIPASGTIVPYKATDLAENAAYQAVIPAHKANVYPNRQINFTLGGNTYTYALEQDFEAGSSYTYNFTLTPQGIILTGNTVAPWGVGTVAWNGDYYLGVSENTVSFYKESTNNNKLTLTTNHSNKPVVNKSSNAITMDGNCNWITLGSVSGTSSPYTYTYNVVENTTGKDREGYLHVTVGAITAVVKIKQVKDAEPITNGNTNCFMLVPGTKIKFPLSRPLAQGTAASNATFTVEKLWDDTLPGGAVTDVSISGTGSNAYVHLTAGTTPGNAVIAAKVNETIVWSYHIWVTNYTGYPTWNNNGFTFMDRNLGATEAANSLAGRGLFYQWGRKDPFPGGKSGTAGYSQLNLFNGISNKITVFSSTSAGAISESINNPTTYYSGIINSNWIPVMDKSMWGHGIGTVKSVYDPCPDGWRVPTYKVAASTFPTTTDTSPWYNMSAQSWSDADTGGTNWGANALYPASGNINYGGWGFQSLGVSAGYWSASPGNPNYPLGMHIANNSVITLSNTYGGANGLSVRCVKQ